MKRFVGFGVCVMLASSASAQFGGSGALGGPYASRGISRPLGGISPPVSPVPGRNSRGPGRAGLQPARPAVYAFPYAYATYVPNYFDSLNYDYWSPQSYNPPPTFYPGAYAAPAAPPVIINQYFSSDNSPSSGSTDGSLQTYRAPSAPVPGMQPPDTSSGAAGEAVSNPQSYYLIAYKDHTIFTVLAYWWEGDTLNYVTTQNTHNQASTNLIDLDLTKTLNQARGMAFTVAGR